MYRNRLIGLCSSALLAGAVAMLAPLCSRAAEPAPTVPVAPAAPAVPAIPNQAQLDAQLAVAQKELERAAHDVARLSTQLSSSLIEQVMPLAEARVIIGVQLEPAAGNVGARVREVSPGGPAHEAGIRPGDVILALNGVELKGESPGHQVSSILHDVKPDSRVAVRAVRDGKPLDFTVTVRGGPALFVSAGATPYIDLDLGGLPKVLVHRPLMDLELATLTPRLGSYFGSEKGVLVVRAPADGVLKLEDGDVILSIDGREPTSGAHATRILSSYQSGEKITLRIIRQHKTLNVESTLPERSNRRETRWRDVARTGSGRTPRPTMDLNTRT